MNLFTSVVALSIFVNNFSVFFRHANIIGVSHTLFAKMSFDKIIFDLTAAGVYLYFCNIYIYIAPEAATLRRQKISPLLL